MPNDMLEISPIPAFTDNYIWLLARAGRAVVVDPGEAAPVLAALHCMRLALDAILITHHHHDHTGGVADLLKLYPAKVYAPRHGQYSFPHIGVAEGDLVQLTTLDLSLRVIELPGHTLDHIAYYGADCVFCGDTLFGGGCGRLFEGTPAQMYRSLHKLSALPANTAVYCAHEYTEHNLRFARLLEPDNAELAARQQQAATLRQRGKPTLPSSIALEISSNPFLRCHIPAIRQAAQLAGNADEIAVFAAIRELRNHY